MAFLSQSAGSSDSILTVVCLLQLVKLFTYSLLHVGMVFTSQFTGSFGNMVIAQYLLEANSLFFFGSLERIY